jgi:hypothetical protein
MLASPLMLHGYEHLELIQVGWFALFMIAWIRLIDEPSLGRLGWAVTGYLLVTMGAPYFGVLAVFPASFYAVWAAVRERGRWSWVRPRLAWLAGFVGWILPLLPILFWGQIWAASQGHTVTRDRAEFDSYGAPAWGYVAPTSLHALGRLLPFDLLETAGFGWRVREKASYLGVATIGLLYVAATRGRRLTRAGYWWACLALLVVLGMGSWAEVGGWRILLPDRVLYEVFPPFRLLRVPGRFNLFAAVVAGVIAAGGLAWVRKRLADRGRWAGDALVGALAVVMVADLGMVPYGSERVPSIPRVYAGVRAADPKALLLEAPQSSTQTNNEISAMAAWWQAKHGMRTMAGYTAHANRPHDERYGFASPMVRESMAEPGYLVDPDRMNVGLMREVGFVDYLWLYARSVGVRHLILHEWGRNPDVGPAIRRIRAQIAGALVEEEAGVAGWYDLSRLPEPRRAVAVPTKGWGWPAIAEGRAMRPVRDRAELEVFRPAGPAPTLEMNLRSSKAATRIQIRSGSRVLGEWDVLAVGYADQRIRLDVPVGVSTVTLNCLGKAATATDRVWVNRVRIVADPSPDQSITGSQPPDE